MDIKASDVKTFTSFKDNTKTNIESKKGIKL